ncbi:hypothetical protein AGMMS49525_12730 [Bacteroidia bacterium]|nr:hypothetical protein AGMMS49525_12730 [Bacteroidia bacterium]
MTPNTYGETAHRTPTWGSLIFVPSFTVDAKGRITAAVTYNVTIPSALASASANGLMSTTQYNLLSGSQTAKTFLAAPNGAAGAPSYRAIVASDVPTLNQNTTGSAGSLANAGTITISSGRSAGFGSTSTEGPIPTYTNGGSISLDVRVPLATDDYAGAASPAMSRAYSVTRVPLNLTTTNNDCALKFGPNAVVANGRTCILIITSLQQWTPTAAQCQNKGMHLATLPEALGIRSVYYGSDKPFSTGGSTDARLWLADIRTTYTTQGTISDYGQSHYTAVNWANPQFANFFIDWNDDVGTFGGLCVGSL